LGIWPATDFRSQPHDPSATYVMIGVLLGAVAIGLLLAWRRRALGMPLYLLTGGCGILLVFALEHVGLSSPWLNAKAMAQGSPALVAAGVAGAAALFETGRRTEAMIACAAIAAGVLWSNGLAYSNAWLAPRGQLAELQTIGSRFAGQGPTLMTEPEVYGTRHFLRRIDPEGAADRRRRPIFLLNGQELAKGTYADLDQFQLGGILVYKTIVLRRSPSESRPPSPYHLVWSGRYYDVWQRPDSFPPILEHFRLGDAIQPGAVPSCSDVLRLAQIAGHSGRLVAAPRTPVIAVTLSNAVHPADWQADPTGLLSPTSAGTVEADVTVPSAGRYGVWLGGSFRDSLHIFVDGRVVAATGQHLNGLDVPLGSVALSPGVHRVALRFGGAGLSPGSGGLPWWTGPLLLSRDSDNPPLVSVPSGDAQALCGQNLDWIEAVGGQ